MCVFDLKSIYFWSENFFWRTAHRIFYRLLVRLIRHALSWKARSVELGTAECTTRARSTAHTFLLFFIFFCSIDMCNKKSLRYNAECTCNSYSRTDIIWQSYQPIDLPLLSSAPTIGGNFIHYTALVKRVGSGFFFEFLFSYMNVLIHARGGLEVINCTPRDIFRHHAEFDKTWFKIIYIVIYSADDTLCII